MTHTRRDFLRRSSLLLPAAALGPQMFMRALSAAPGGAQRNLVLIDLIGGNDGLNTVVPYGLNGGAYYTDFRPTLGVPEAELLKIPGEPLGFNPAFAELAQHYAAGRLAIVQGVGYPAPNFSHEVSRRIWQTGSPGGATASFSDGWLARYLNLYPAPTTPCAADVSDRDFPLFEGVEGFVPTLFVPGDYAFPTDAQQPGDSANRKLAYAAMTQALANHPGLIGKVAHTASGVLNVMSLVSTLPPINYFGTYPQSPLAIALQTILALMNADLGMRIFYIAFPEFDHHSLQNVDDRHRLALTAVSQSLNGFYTDLVAHNLDQDTLVVVSSEFGRTVYENGSGGTDHGTVNASFVFGTPVIGGLVTPHPGLDPSALDEFDELPRQADYRDIFATVLKRWYGESPATIQAVFPGHAMTDLGFLA